MDFTLTAERLMLFGGIGVFALTLHWVRKRDLREKFAVGWLCAASMLLLCGLFPGLIKSFAEAVHLAYSSAVLYISLVAIYVFLYFTSVSLSKQYRRNIRLTQEVAILDARVRALEDALREKQPAPKPVLSDLAGQVDAAQRKS